MAWMRIPQLRRKESGNFGGGPTDAAIPRRGSHPGNSSLIEPTGYLEMCSSSSPARSSFSLSSHERQFGLFSLAGARCRCRRGRGTNHRAPRNKHGFAVLFTDNIRMGEHTDDGRGLGAPSYPQMRMWLRPCSPTCEAVSDKKPPPIYSACSYRSPLTLKL